MAALQERNGSFRVIFWFNGKQRAFTLGPVTEEEANDTASTVGNLLRGIEEQRIRISTGVDVVSFLRQRLASLHRETDDTPEPPPQPRQQITLGILRDRYISTHSNGTIEANSLATVRLHFSHFCRDLGEGLPLSELSLSRLQDYVDGRARKGISPTTMRKEVASVRAAWNWGVPMNLTTGSFPAKGLRYPKDKEKPKFQTLGEIQAAVAAGGDPDELWECLYLELGEIAELLAYAKDHATQPFLYPMLSFAAHTGARRSELLRSLVSDVDFKRETVLVREKKRSRGK